MFSAPCSCNVAKCRRGQQGKTFSLSSCFSLPSVECYRLLLAFQPCVVFQFLTTTLTFCLSASSSSAMCRLFLSFFTCCVSSHTAKGPPYLKGGNTQICRAHNDQIPFLSPYHTTKRRNKLWIWQCCSLHTHKKKPGTNSQHFSLPLQYQRWACRSSIYTPRSVCRRRVRLR
jgi:hypothetical protein